ncbi:hypothetical protein CLAFUW4_02057 [Fulvia fulva]|uniref:Uncharacterized protein n=1 Tax=Passalora fulva TaxID=5499 RepID=A0A9Q8L5H8_PASFU|nr:uncharacterized protein CLAFUR5_02050 [Fulvia fulva]KAK4635712.1 hypothetical protein CLAFUR4_02053 [Fulvia fulva]KAK4636444.1 hypothetical protein CLAFUR0_02056 [Fulvia fulva]UJO11194.1 hypothetical protein CLAFUR5_02050 [Fulvia fulva]WPV09115.1 hypothetical protein CLAFUW4_02057 [Fulvia fulva]WPV23088.1 hypothetical protein CLAFUW7_02057 [Fulvia fulva]
MRQSPILEMEKSADSAERSRAASMTHDVAIRESAAPIPRSVDRSRHPSVPVNGPDRLHNDVWASAISRLQAQVSYNTGMLESHRRQFTDMEAAITRLHQEMTSMVVAINDVRAEVRSRPAAAEPSRHDPADLDVLALQLQRLTNRVNEIDGLNMQMDLVKNRMQRLEGGALEVAPVRRSTASQHEAHYHEAVPPPPTQHVPHHPPPVPHPPLPPMRTASINSPEANRPPPHTLDHQVSHGYRPSSESRPYPGETPAGPPPSQGPGIRPGESLPPPSALSGWRPADSFPPSGAGANAPGSRPHAMEAEAGRDGSSGWAAVNGNPAIKRPPQESRSPFGSPSIDGSKRQRLAPLMPNMPRSNYSDESHPHSQPPFAPAGTGNLSEASFGTRSRAPSDGAQSLAQPEHPTPASQLQHSFRFITSTSQLDGSDPWRQSSEREPHHTHPHVHGHHGHSHGHGHGPPHGHGRAGRGGRGGRGRGRGSRGGRGGAGATHHEPQEMGMTPEPEYASGRGSPANGIPEQPHSFSPDAAARGGIMRRGDSHIVAPPERQHEFPATPVQQPPSLDPYAAPADGPQTSSGKKTRTKPIRNAEGILIRKDGRPDMRSVSSANNLRKVHAKKEAERAEMEGTDEGDGITRSGTPTSAAAGENDNDGDHDDEASEEPSDTQERHRQLMNQLYSSNIGGPGRVAEQFFPRHHEDAQAQTESERQNREESTQGEDVVMKETNVAQAEARGEQSDVKRVDHGSVEQNGGGDDRKVVKQPPAAA